MNYRSFADSVPRVVKSNAEKLKGKQHLVESYARIASLNALKFDLVEICFSKEACHFFYEAHNDALLSHFNASIGSWRLALQSLRSLMENTLAAIYFTDHPIELQKWEKDSFRIPPRELREYVARHPKIESFSTDIELLGHFNQEYSTLSKAVHASDNLFRMTSADGKTNIAETSDAGLGKWAARERNTINLCAVSIVAIWHEHLDGAKMYDLRRSLGYSIQKKGRNALKKHFSVNIPEPK